MYDDDEDKTRTAKSVRVDSIDDEDWLLSGFSVNVNIRPSLVPVKIFSYFSVLSPAILWDRFGCSRVCLLSNTTIHQVPNEQHLRCPRFTSDQKFLV
jgi:hypothetical protein